MLLAGIRSTCPCALISSGVGSRASGPISAPFSRLELVFVYSVSWLVRLSFGLLGDVFTSVHSNKHAHPRVPC